MGVENSFGSDVMLVFMNRVMARIPGCDQVGQAYFQVGGIGHWRGFDPSGLCQSEHIRYPQ